MDSRTPMGPLPPGTPPTAELSPEAARQGATPRVTRYVLAIGTILAVVALGVVLALGGL